MKGECNEKHKRIFYGQQWISNVRDEAAGKYYQYVYDYVITDDTRISIESDAPSENSRLVMIVPKYEAQNRSNLSDGSAILCNIATGMNNDIYKTDVPNTVGYTSNFDYIRIRLPLSAGSTFDEIRSYILAFLEPVHIIYVLATPIVTDIPAEEMAAYNAMHTNKPNTNVYTDQEVQPGLELDYTADTKTYIDNKFNAIAKEILNGR